MACWTCFSHRIHGFSTLWGSSQGYDLLDSMVSTAREELAATSLPAPVEFEAGSFARGRNRADTHRNGASRGEKRLRRAANLQARQRFLRYASVRRFRAGPVLLWLNDEAWPLELRVRVKRRAAKELPEGSLVLSYGAQESELPAPVAPVASFWLSTSWCRREQLWLLSTGAIRKGARGERGVRRSRWRSGCRKRWGSLGARGLQL